MKQDKTRKKKPPNPDTHALEDLFMQWSTEELCSPEHKLSREMYYRLYAHQKKKTGE